MRLDAITMYSLAIDSSHVQALVAFATLVFTVQFIAIFFACFYMQKKYLGLVSQRRRYSLSDKLFYRLEASFAQLQVLEKIHLANLQQTLADDIEEQLHVLWIDIEKALGQFAFMDNTEQVNFSILSVRAGFDLYRQMQRDFLQHSKLGEKGFALHLLNSKGKDLCSSLQSLLTTERHNSFRHLLTGYKIIGLMDFVWMVYPLILIFLSVSALIGMYIWS